MTPSEAFRASETNVGMCGHCSQQNEPDAKFCGDCGQPLWESCEVCETLSPIGRRFCRGCGGNLHQQLSNQLEQHEERIQHGIRLAEEHRYDDAIDVIRQQQVAADYRFGRIAERANEVLARLESTRNRWFAKRDAAVRAANQAWVNEEHQRVAQLLQQIPTNLLDDGAKELLTASTRTVDRLTHLRSKLKKTLADREYRQAGIVLNQLMTLVPERTEYREVAEKVAQALMASAERRLQRGRYQEAVQRLEAIPSTARNEKTNQMIAHIDDILWMIRQFAHEPFAFPRLGRLAQRLAKRVPEDPRSKQLVQELIRAVKQPAPDPRQHVASWRGSDSSWLGSPVRILAFPQRLRIEDRDRLQKQPGAFSVAFGLALQGLGLGRVTDPLHIPKKKGIKGILPRRVQSECIGIDLGSTAVRTVHLRRSGNGEVAVVNCWQRAFEQPLCRAGVDVNVSDIRRRGLERIAEQIAEIDAPVWVNLPGRDVLGRFLHLPPIKDKDASNLLNKEIDRQVPVGRDDLQVVRWLQSARESEGSRYGALIACRNDIASARVSLFNDAGIEPAAIQCDPVALVNFVAFEFQEHFTQPQGDGASQSPGIALLDAGASAVTFLTVSERAFWFRSLDGGGEDFTAQLAREAAMTAEQAEKCKRDPSTLPAPAVRFVSIEQRFAATRHRLQQIAADSQEFMSPFTVDTLWTCGGASLMHGWLSQVLCQPRESR